MTIEEILALFSVISGALLVIQAYLVFRVDRARLGLERYLGILEKSELRVKPKIQPNLNETILLTNDGLIPIEEIEAKIDAKIESKKKQIVEHFEWERRTILSSKEQTVVPLYEKLDKLIGNEGLMTYEEEQFTIEDPETGEDVDDVLLIPRLSRPFSCELSIEVTSKMLGQSKIVKKKFVLSYTYSPQESYYDPDYQITVIEHMGTWKV